MKMNFLYLFGFIAGWSNYGVTGRSVNISNAWFLPQEGFPVFYRYFNDKITWNEAEAVCGFHHADLLSVQTSSQMDAARAYLKEIDVTDNIWIGLQKDSPENPFSWTNGEKLLGDGYWTEPIPKTNEKLCGAIDPVADFRWNSFYCRGPQVASFVCELPVPDWAKKENGCLITSLPSLTVTLLPEVGVIQLLSDCGLDGTRRIACNGGMNREEIIKRLSCDVDAFANTIIARSTMANTEKQINTEQSPESDLRNQSIRYKTSLRSFQTRHRRSPNSSTVGTTSTPAQEKMTSPSRNAFLNVPSRGFPHSPYLASVRNAPSTSKPPAVKINSRKKPGKGPAATEPALLPPIPSSPNETNPLHKDLPLLLITEKKSNESNSSATSENPQLVLMIENKDLDEPFLVPLSDDIFINNPSLSPVEVINVDLVEVDNLTANSTVNQTTPAGSPELPAVFQPQRFADGVEARVHLSTTSQTGTEEFLNAVQGEDKGADIPHRPKRGRFLTHSSRPSFYPRLLNRVLG